MRLRMTTRPSVLFAAMLVVALIVFLPMSLALGATGLADEGLSARRVGGTIWGGSLLEARFGDVALGDLRVSLSPFALLVGRARLAFEGAGADGRPIMGAATIGRHAMGIDGVTASLPAAALFAPLPVTTLALEDVTVRFRDGVCEEAGGRVRATVPGDAGGGHKVHAGWAGVAGDFGAHQRGLEEGDGKVRRPAEWKKDEERRPRGMEEMEAEAGWLREEMERDERGEEGRL